MRAILALLIATVVVPAFASPSTPILSVHRDQEVDQLWIEVSAEDGETSRRLLRRAETRIVPGSAGTDPTGKTAFATWTENGDERWAAYSRDAGSSWSTAVPEPTELRFLRETLAPGVAASAVEPSLALPAEGRVRVVQFKSISLPEWREALESAGAEILAPFPDNAHLVRLDPETVARVEALEFVERSVPFHPAYRLEDELLSWLQSQGEPEELRVNLLSFGWGAEPKSRIAAAAEAAGARLALWIPKGRRMELWVTRDQLRDLAAHDEVAWIDRWAPPENDMDLVREDSGADYIEALDGSCGQGVRGEVMDGGIQVDHPDFDGILLHGPTGLDSHGTSTYGVVFGNGDRDGDGDPQATGHLPCAEQGIFASYPDMTDRFAHTQELKAAPYYASFQSNSWGNNRTVNYNSYSVEMDDIIFQLDIAITQSQSNAGSRQSRPEAWAKNVISIGGIRHLNTLDPSDDNWSSTGSIGPAADGRIKPDVSYWNDSIYTTTTGGYTSGFNGTSASTPEVAGILGLMVQMWSENVWGTNPTGSTVFERQPHFATIKALLINNAWQYPFVGDDHDLTRVHQGWGLPRVGIARDRASNSFIVDQDQPLTLAQKVSYDLDVRSDETELKVTMVFPDPPGDPAAALQRINDLNLKVTSPTGTFYLGNTGLDIGVYSIPGGSQPNDYDTVENVFVPYPEPGTWTVEVEAAEINADGHPATPQDDVVFALVVTGAGTGGQCGNGVREPGEDCDGTDLGGRACDDLGCSGGALDCNIDCTYDTATCNACSACGDGTCDTGETCLTCAADCYSESALTCGNGLCETADGEDCETCSADCRGVTGGTPSGRYCCGGSGTYGVDCTDDRCTDFFDTCIDYPSVLSCCGDTVCEGNEDLVSCAVDCTSPTPGEAGSHAAGMMMADYDRTSGIISLTWADGCATTDHVVEYGELTPANLAAYQWIGQECGLGTGSDYGWTPPASPDSLFFVIVGNDGVVEGSYGTDSSFAERPEDSVSSSCPLPQELTARCD